MVLGRSPSLPRGDGPEQGTNKGMTLLEEQRDPKGKILAQPTGSKEWSSDKGRRRIPYVEAIGTRKVSKRGGPVRGIVIQGGDKGKNRAICKETHQRQGDWMSEGEVKGSYGCRGRRQTPGRSTPVKSSVEKARVGGSKVAPKATEEEPKEPNGEKGREE